MLQVCNYGKGYTPGWGMTLSEYRAHYAVWAILASPLILGFDVRRVAADHPECLAMVLNEDIVAVNQDPAGLPPRLVAHAPDGEHLGHVRLRVRVRVRVRVRYKWKRSDRL